MSYTRAAAVGLLFILCSTFWKGSDGCSVNISVTGSPLISVSEGKSYMQITLTRDNATSGVTVKAYPHIATVTNGSDVILSNTTILFFAGENSVSTNISIVSDQSLENNEIFFIQFVSTDPDVCVVNDNITVQITDDDKVTVGFSETTIYVREDAVDGSVRFTFTLRVHTAVPVTIGYMTTGVGNATSGVDYTSKSEASWYTFSSGATSGSEEILGLLLNDHVLEGTECFQVNLTTTLADVILSPDSATVCVTNDDDKVQLNFLFSSMTVEEDKGHISIPVNKTGRSASPVNFRLTMNEKYYSTATRGDDYQDRHGNIITFPATDQQLSTMYVNVTIKMDGKAESSEVFVVGLEAVDNSTTTIGGKESMDVKITDQKDNDDFEAREEQRDQDEKKRIDNLRIILYTSIAFVALVIIILIIICVLVIKKWRKKENA